MEDETSPRLDRAAVMDCHIRSLAGVEVELLQECPEFQAGPFVANSHSDGPILVMDAHRDHGPLEPRVGHSRHRQEKFSGEERSALHSDMMGRRSGGGKAEQALRRSL
jgi:hypothetical protein